MDKNDAEFIGSIPEHYDRGLGPVIFAGYAADIARRAAAAAPKRVLETAAGTGIVTRQLRDALPADARLTATDLNPPMLAIARAKFQPGEDVAFQPADATALPFADASFEVVVCQFGVMFYPDKDKSYRDAHRVLAPGGRYIFSVWDTHGHNPFGRIGWDVTRSYFPVDPPQFYNVPFSYAAIDPIKASLQAAGFGAIEVSVVPLVTTIADSAAFARGLVLGNPVSEQIKTRGGVDLETVVDRIRTDLRRECGPDPARMAIQAIVFSAEKPS